MADRYELYKKLQLVIAGSETRVAMEAVSDSLASTIAFAADDLNHAEEILFALSQDILSTIRENWGHIRTIRSASLLSVNSEGQM